MKELLGCRYSRRPYVAIVASPLIVSSSNRNLLPREFEFTSIDVGSVCLLSTFACQPERSFWRETVPSAETGPTAGQACKWQRRGKQGAVVLDPFGCITQAPPQPAGRLSWHNSLMVLTMSYNCQALQRGPAPPKTLTAGRPLFRSGRVVLR